MLIDLDNTLIVYFKAAIDAQWPNNSIDVVTAAIGDTTTANAVYLILDQVTEHQGLKGTGESTRVDDHHQTYHLPAPIWLQCQYWLIAAVDESVVGQAPFDGLNLRQTQLTLLEPVIKKLMIAEPVLSQYARGIYVGDDYLIDGQVNEKSVSKIIDVKYQRLYQQEGNGLPVVEFSITAEAAIQDEVTTSGPILDVQIDAAKV